MTTMNSHRTHDQRQGNGRPATMRAVVRHHYGSPDVLQVEDLPVPTPGAGEVLVRVVAASVSRGDWHMMTGRPYLMRLVGFGLRRPRVPGLGSDLAGVVEAVGPDVTGFAPGDEVFGVGRQAFAQYAVAPARKLARKPASVSFEHAAAVPVSALTALQALRDQGRLRAGQHVLVIGASGGVGSFAVQIAKAWGAEVTGVCSTAKTELVKGLGADHVIDYTQREIDAEGPRYDLVLDIGGNRRLGTLRRALAPGGTLVFVGGEDGGPVSGGLDRQLRASALSPFVGQRLGGMWVTRENGGDLEVLSPMLADGSVVPAVDRVCRLDDVRQALHDLEAGRVRGKVVVVP
jgi:NADPH:quinone reductase-like Zn-dependent oxidoreductase